MIDECRLLSAKEVAEILGVDRLTIYKMIKAGELEAVRVRRAVRIPAAALAKLPPYADRVHVAQG